VELQLDGKVALVTGTSNGIGRHVAGNLAAEDTEAAITVRRPGAPEPTAREIRSATRRRALARDSSVAPDVARCGSAAVDR
jgi:NAD(P)-dependent dehydrogenase (short-subunit alcohol dehydrogenase family)